MIRPFLSTLSFQWRTTDRGHCPRVCPTAMAFNAVNDLFLPAVKEVAGIPKEEEPKRAPGGWALEPAMDDATLTIPAGARDDLTMLTRLCELLPKMWLLCCVHCATLTTAGIGLASNGSHRLPLCGLASVLFAAWVTLYLAAGVLENTVRRHVWMRLLENGLLLRPAPTGYVMLLRTPEFMAIGGGLSALAVALAALGDLAAALTVGAAASSVLILAKAWVADWRVPSAPAVLCDGADINVAFAEQLTLVDEIEVAKACAAMPLDGPTSFVALCEAVRAASAAAAPRDGGSGDDGKDGEDAAGGAAWAVQRNWAMRFMGIAPPIALFAPILGLLPVRRTSSFKSAKDRLFAERMAVWNVVTIAAALFVQLRLCLADGALGLHVPAIVFAFAVAVATPALEGLLDRK